MSLAPGEGADFDSFRGPATLAVGGFHGCGFGDEDGGLRCFGNNQNAQLGDGGTEEQVGFVAVDLRWPGFDFSPGLVADNPSAQVDGTAGGVRPLAAGLLHTCATDGDRVVCWGDSSYDQLGHRRGPLAAEVEGLPIDDRVVVQLAAGAFHTCALMRSPDIAPGEDDDVYCWGDDRFGALGDGEAGGTRREPVRVSLGGPVVGVAAGAHTTCALVLEEAVLGAAIDLVCWGRGLDGELADGLGESSATPRATALHVLPERSIYLSLGGLVPVEVRDGRLAPAGEGRGHGCVQIDELVGCWGDNRFGQLLGDEVSEQVLALTLAPLPESIPPMTIRAGGGFSCGLAGTDGRGGLFCWGRNDAGQLGSEGPGQLLPVPATALVR